VTALKILNGGVTHLRNVCNFDIQSFHSQNERLQRIDTVHPKRSYTIAHFNLIRTYPSVFVYLDGPANPNKTWDIGRIVDDKIKLSFGD